MHQRWIMLCAIGVAIAYLPLVGHAQNETYKVLNTGGFTPKIDADLGDWSLVKEGVVMDKFTANGGKWNGKQDLSGTFWLLWNSDGLFLAIDVTDDQHINTNVGDKIWDGDSTQVFIDPTGERPAGGGNGVAYEFNFGLGGAKSDAPQFSRALSHAKAPADVTVEYAFARDDAAKKTIYELFFPKKDIAPAKMEKNEKLGFALIVNDGDKGEEGQKGWIGWGENAIVFGKDAASTNLIILSDTPLSVDPRGKLATSWARIKSQP